MSYDIKESMLFLAEEDPDSYGDYIAVEVCQRTCKENRSYIVRIAFNYEDEFFEVAFRRRKQLFDLYRALSDYLYGHDPSEKLDEEENPNEMKEGKAED